MKTYNYFRLLGKFYCAQQIIAIEASPRGSAEKRLVVAVRSAADAHWERRERELNEQAARTGETPDLETARAQIQPREEAGVLYAQLQYAFDELVRKVAAIQNTASIHSEADRTVCLETMETYGVELVNTFRRVTFQSVSWSEKANQLPKLLVFATDAAGEEICIRFEARVELAQKFLFAALESELSPGTVFDLRVEAVDPAVAINQKAGKQVKKEGVFVNHNLVLRAGGTSHYGRHPSGTFTRLTTEAVHTLFEQLRHNNEAQAPV